MWFTQVQMAELFQKDRRTISDHINNVFEESELAPDSTIRNFLIVQYEGNREVERDIAHYNLDVAMSVTVLSLIEVHSFVYGLLSNYENI